jgi:hypothetical protein
MEKIPFSLSILLLLLLLCHCVPSPSSLGDLPVIDINETYPEDTIVWEDKIASIEYIALETSDEFLCGMGEIVAFTDSIIIYYNNFWVDNVGDILIFDGKGKGLRKINRRGQSGMEYAYPTVLTYDDSAKELLVYDLLHKIFVYNLEGTFKRVLICPPYKFDDREKTMEYNEIEVFDNQSLLCYANSDYTDYPFTLISKQTGEKIQDIAITPYQERLVPEIVNGTSVLYTFSKHIVAHHPFLLKHPSSDTIYSFSHDRILKPYLVQTPSVLENEARPSFLFPILKIDRHLLLKSITKNSAGKKLESSLFLFDSENEQLVMGNEFPPIETAKVHSFKPNVFMEVAVYFDKVEIRPAMDAQLQKLLRKRKDDDNPILKKTTFKE